jgi:hypothetical protein
MNQLSSAMSELNEMKEGMCQGGGMPGDRDGDQKGPGMGSRGQGEGNIASEEETDIKTAERRTPVHTDRGSIISTQFVDGEQFKGDVSQEMVQATLAEKRDVTDAIANEEIPRVYHSSIQKYLTRSIRDLPADKLESAEQQAESQEP